MSRCPWRLSLLLLLVTGCDGDETDADPAPWARTQPAYTAREEVGGLPELRFTEITQAAGLDFVHVTGAFGEKWMPETIGSGGGFLDYDGDGLPDILLVNSTEWPGHETPDRDERNPSPAHTHLYRNLGDGTFADVSRATGIARHTEGVYGMGAVFADYDGDADTDIYLTALGENRLLRNDGGAFVRVPGAAGATGASPDPDAPPAWSTAAAWLDADRDGWLDLFVCNYVRWTPETDLFTTRDGVTKSYATPEHYPGESCRMYRNREGIDFVDITAEAGVENPEGKSLGVVVTDLDGDGWSDIFVANDMQPNFLYRNQGDGTFRDIALDAGVAFDEFGRTRAGMGVDVGDVTGRGDLSIAVGNFSHEPVALFTPVGGGVYQDLAGSARLARATLRPLTFGLAFLDVNLDGYLDLVLANGHIEPEIARISEDLSFPQRPRLFLNTGSGGFVDATRAAGEAFARPLVGRGIAFADIDGDADLDLLLTANGGPPRLLRNDTPRDALGGAITLRLAGAPPNRDAVGARIRLFAGTRIQHRQIRSGSSYLSQSLRNPALFGVGERAAADSIEVVWPDGAMTLARGPFATGTSVTLTHPSILDSSPD
ncbi:MAG: CRTAC1 family protein [Longimicrobiales bacterium]|nr:CRTAC1 family protein [Longimicrobiales bacterium]